MSNKVFVTLSVALALGFAGGWFAKTMATSTTSSQTDAGASAAVAPQAQGNADRGQAFKERRLKRRDRGDGEAGMRDRRAERLKDKQGDGSKPVRPPNKPTEDPNAVYKFLVGDSPVHGPATAKITLIEVSDYECPFCVRGNDTVNELLKLYPNDLRVVMKQNPLSFHKYAKDAATAALAAGAQGKYWQMHEKLFESTKTKTPLTRERLDALAKELGLDMGKFSQALDSDMFAAQIKQEQQTAVALGARGTPAFFINGRKLSGARPIEHFKALIDEELKKADALLAKGIPADKLYEEITKDASQRVVLLPGAVEPSNPFMGTGPAKDVPIPTSSPTLGPDNAKVTLVEFLDFECPYCANGAKDVLELAKLYPNDLKVVFRHQPLPFHKNAKAAAQASMAAHYQGKFWAMEQKLFDNMKSLSEEKIEALAAEVGLDMARFKSDWKSADTEKLVAADMAEGKRLGATGTPTFFINGRTLVGARPIGSLREIIDEEIAKAAK
ncbi:MAG: thioredoxin domain-containing protein [Myxococcales bacterium]|nr:thioredoxin domain-containing protein [Myxococcales bacterium]